MKIRIYRETSIQRFITVNEDSIEIAQKMNGRGEYDLLWEASNALNHIGDQFSYTDLPSFDNEEIGKVDEETV